MTYLHDLFRNFSESNIKAARDDTMALRAHESPTSNQTPTKNTNLRLSPVSDRRVFNNNVLHQFVSSNQIFTRILLLFGQLFVIMTITIVFFSLRVLQLVVWVIDCFDHIPHYQFLADISTSNQGKIFFSTVVHK